MRRQKKEIDSDGIRYFNLRIMKKSISPCVITWDHKNLNQIFWNGKELPKTDIYWFGIEKVNPKIGDRFEIVISHKMLGEIIRGVTLEVIELNESKIRAIEIARFKHGEPGEQLTLECKVCPTCKRTL